MRIFFSPFDGEVNVSVDLNVAFQHFTIFTEIAIRGPEKKMSSIPLFSGGSMDRFTQHLTDLIHLNSNAL